ncbi:MAG: hypothetical protein IKG21_04430 [Atopobiaceae bacterium]|nr:hypothetical protein [Atopobiaceae bacterium]
MAATALVSARLDPSMREQATAILRKANLTDTTVIRRVYEYIVTTGDVPEFVKTGEFEVGAPAERDHFDDMAEWLACGPFADEDWTWLSDDVVADSKGRGWNDE